MLTQCGHKLFKAFGHFILVVFITSFLHWSLVNFYSWNCVDSSWTGALTHIINLGSPFCQFINYIQFEISHKSISNLAMRCVGDVLFFFLIIPFPFKIIIFQIIWIFKSSFFQKSKRIHKLQS